MGQRADAIRGAVYGKDVRETLAVGMEYVEGFGLAEEGRIAAENARVSTEIQEAVIESQRVNADIVRANNETIRTATFNTITSEYQTATLENTSLEVVQARRGTGSLNERLEATDNSIIAMTEYLSYMPIEGGSFDGGVPEGVNIDGGTY